MNKHEINNDLAIAMYDAYNKLLVDDETKRIDKKCDCVEVIAYKVGKIIRIDIKEI